MRIYTIHERPSVDTSGDEYIFLKDGFIWSAFLAPPIWALHHRLWLVLSVTLVIMVSIPFLFAYLQPDWISSTAMAFASLFLFSHHANDMRALSLQRKDYSCVGLIAAANTHQATERFFFAQSFIHDNRKII